jgi:hypothetical protein
MKKHAWGWIVIGILSLAFGGLCQASEGYVLDQYEVKSATVSSGSPILIKDFSTENTYFGKLKKEKQKETAAMMKRAAPSAFTESLKSRLDESGVFGEIGDYDDGEVTEGSLLIEGEFTVLNPGNRAARYWSSGLGGKSEICFVGRVLNADGAKAVTFEDCRNGIGFWSVGGESSGLMMADLDHAAEALTTVLAAWVRGELPVGVASGESP